MANPVIGWDGMCAEHRTTPSICRPTGRDVRVDLTKNGVESKAFCRVLEIHCAAGHHYEAIDIDDDLIRDPYNSYETAKIEAEETAHGGHPTVD
jgi:hypothetical protein